MLEEALSVEADGHRSTQRLDSERRRAFVFTNMVHYLEVTLSATPMVVSASFISGILALSLQPIGLAHAVMAEGNQSESRIEKPRQSDAESRGTMQRKTDPYSDGGQSDPSSQFRTGQSPSSGSNQRGQQGTGNSMSDPNRTMQSDRDSMAGGGTIDPSSKLESQSQR
jgi:hypothetical protein